ncbi:ribulokinase [Kushneria sinocarnis]|uniref:Ribulokinase n=1 Tax=Kushneria sinocarnis TaxID=595502 RepID=A0A420X161_9GAMM|nr:FGGY-family carbohydrate kinase [Kushneria sinocarnis]RKR07581.1 ribulokinase [Kushneria sinocarnis]
MPRYHVGVDVGSASVRAGVFDTRGHCLAQAARPIEQYRPRAEFVEQSSDNIWQQCVAAVREAVERAAVAPGEIAALGFDATCSLVALGADGRPVSVSPSEEADHNIVMWMDHRATAEAEEITATGHEALKYIGGQVSPELELPKLLWLKRHRPDQFAHAALYLDLADFMVARAIGDLEGPQVGEPGRSVCTQVCKWLYLAHEGRWPEDLLARLGLEALLEKPAMQGAIRAVGSRAGTLSAAAAEAMGLSGEVVVATGLIDAHAGALGMLGEDPEGSLAVIAGTSACHIAFSREPCFVPGVWGPYWGAVLPDGWINEGGQSAVGALIDHVITDSAACDALKAAADTAGISHFELLNRRLAELEHEHGELTAEVHLLDYHHGNRSPRADASLRGMYSGLDLNEDIDALAVRYLATLQAIAYGTRHIIEALNAHGHAIERLRLCGGALKNERWLQEMADATGLPIELPAEPETVLLGGAMLAATACGDYPSLREAAAAMSGTDRRLAPNPARRRFHAAKYRVYHELHADQLKYRELMRQA